MDLRIAQKAARAAARFAPTLEERRERADVVLPDPIPSPETAPGLSAERSALTGIDLRTDDQIARLRWWRHRGRDPFNTLRYDPAVNRSSAADAVRNDQFASPDAEVYMALIGDFQPRRILEFGSGFATIVARRAIDYFDLHTELEIVDLEPDPNLVELVDHVLTGRPEWTSPDDLHLDSVDLLFLDTSHVVSTGGDVTYIFNEVIPRLRTGTLVHVHDVFLPYGYPRAEARSLWNEQYLLQAYLTGNPRARVVFSSHYMCRDHLQEMQSTFGLVAGSEAWHFGRSFWFEILGT